MVSHGFGVVVTNVLASWIEELTKPPFRCASGSDEPDIAARRRRAALSAFENALPSTYRWARLDSPLLVERVKLATIPRELPTSQSVIFVGPPGVGKTSLSVALLRATLARDLEDAALTTDDDAERFARRYRFAHAHRLGVARISGPAAVAELESAIRLPMLLLDDLGADSKVSSSAVPEVIAERHAEQRVTWITTSLEPKEIAQRYGGGIARRILEHAKTMRLA
jgi:hypothetical protein